MRNDLSTYLTTERSIAPSPECQPYVNVDGALVTSMLPCIVECPMTAKDCSRALHACHIQAGTAPMYVRLSAAYSGPATPEHKWTAYGERYNPNNQNGA